MTEKEIKKPGTTIYINDDALDALVNIEIEAMGMKIKKNSEKILFLVNFYKENKNK